MSSLSLAPDQVAKAIRKVTLLETYGINLQVNYLLESIGRDSNPR